MTHEVHEGACEVGSDAAAAVVSLPRRFLIVQCGPAGAGKSTFAADFVQRKCLPVTTVVSSDACRLMLCDDTRTVSPAQWEALQASTFRLFLTVIERRVGLGRPVVADGVNLHAELRSALVGFARACAYRSLLVVFDVPLATSLARNARRAEGQRIPERQIRAQRQALDDVLPRLTDEGWDQVVVVDGQLRTPVIVLDR